MSLDRLSLFWSLPTALLAVLASVLIYFVIRLWRVRSFFIELQKRGLVRFSIFFQYDGLIADKT